MKKFFSTRRGILYQGDVLEVLQSLPDESVDCIITSPPYWGLRDYGVEGQIGLEPSLDEYLEKLLRVTAELRRVLKSTGVMFWNHGDNYGNSGGKQGGRSTRPNLDPAYEMIRPRTPVPQKSLCLQNYRLAIRMIDEQGWILRNVIIWYKPNHMPASVKDRFAVSYEPVFMFVKSKKYWFDLDAVRLPLKESSLRRWEFAVRKNETYGENTNLKAERESYSPQSPYAREGRPSLAQSMDPARGANPGDVWSIPTQPLPEPHFAAFPEGLVEPMILSGCPQWICRKCGRARERIVRTEKHICREINTKKGRGIRSSRIGSPFYCEKKWIAAHHTVGWTDCGCNAGWEAGVVLDPFMGSGTVALVAERLNRRWIGIELSEKYCEITRKRLIKELGIMLLGGGER